MLIPDTPHGMDAADRALTAIEDREPSDQLTGAGWAVVSVLGAVKSRFERTIKEREAFDFLCSETQAWLRREIEALRFTKAHREAGGARIGGGGFTSAGSIEEPEP